MSDPTEAAKDRFVWFEGQSVTELKERLNRYKNPRLEIRERDGEYYLRVASDDEASALSESDINFSHVCPPFCP